MVERRGQQLPKTDMLSGSMIPVPAKLVHTRIGNSWANRPGGPKKGNKEIKKENLRFFSRAVFSNFRPLDARIPYF